MVSSSENVEEYRGLGHVYVSLHFPFLHSQKPCCYPTTGLVCGPLLLLSHCRASFTSPLWTCHFSCLIVSTSFQSHTFFKELSSSSCLIQSSHPTSSAHSPCLLQVLKSSSSKPASPSSVANTSPGIFLSV